MFVDGHQCTRSASAYIKKKSAPPGSGDPGRIDWLTPKGGIMKTIWDPFRELVPFASFPEVETYAGSMRYMMLFAALLMVCSVASGQVLTLTDVKAKSAVQLSADDLKQLLPGATVQNQTQSGATVRWKNSLSGDFVASNDGRGHSPPAMFTGSGTWKIDDKGAYCVQIRWPWSRDDWCRYVFKAGDKYYAFDTLEDTAQSWEFEISK